MAEPNRPLRVLLIHDEAKIPPTASDVEANLAAHADEVEFIGSAKTGQEGIDKSLALSPDVVLVSGFLSDMHTKDIVRRLRADHPELLIITAPSSNNPEFIMGTLDAGADDFIGLPLLTLEDYLLRIIQKHR